MADLVNATHKERLSQRDSEPTHLKGGSYDDLGGTGIDSEPNSVKIDAARGVKGQDTSIIGAGQNSEKSHLKTEGEDDVDVKFDGDGDLDADDIDKQLDEFEDVEPVDVDVDVTDDDKKDVKESRRVKGRSLKEDGSWGSEKDPKDIEEDEEQGENNGEMEASMKAPEAAMNSGPNKVTEGDLPPWLKKDGDDDEKKDLDEDEIVIKKDDSSDEKKDEGDDEKKPNPFEKKEKVDESVHITIKRPNVKLLESAGVPAKAQKRVAMIFETVVKDVATQVTRQLHRHYKKLHEAKLAKRDAVLAKQMDSYLNYVVESWVKDNRVPIRKALKSQLAEEFLGAFQTMMREHYIDVPASKVDVVKTLSTQVAKLKKSLTEQTAQKMKLRKIAESANKQRIVAQFAKSQALSEAQTAKLDKLVESVSYTNAADFRSKLGMLKESYFNGGTQKTSKKLVLPEEKVSLQEDVKPGKKQEAIDPDVAAIAGALKRANTTY